ncbi:hypothetical protein RYX36_025158 [Vicia faba]
MSTWLSATVSDEVMYVTKKKYGMMYSFDCKMIKWEAPYDLRREESVFFSIMGMMRDRLVVVGIVGDVENKKGVKIWELVCIGDFIYVYNPLELEEMVVCEVLKGGGCEWQSVRNKVVDDGVRMGRVVLCGGDVRLEDLKNAVLRKCRFELKHV